MFSMSDDENDEPPSEVWFENHQWSVTDYGVEAVRPAAPYYHFDKTRLLEAGNSGGELYDWPAHMAEKTWVDIEAFIEAFVKALELHAGKYGGTVDEAMLKKSIERARREAARRGRTH
jgi:hypothetical protein